MKKGICMKKFNIIILTLLICIFSQIGVFAFGNSNSDDDIIIPSAGVTLDKDGKPDAWISVPKSLRSKGTPVQDENDHIYVEPKNR